MTSVWLACLGLAGFILVQVSTLEPLVKLSHGGDLVGSVLSSQQGRLFYAFRGIPFAEPPVGERRFQPPVPKASWHGHLLDASKDGPTCVKLRSTVITGQEDCLYLNVYTPQIPDKNGTILRKLAVLVWIHGGEGKGTSDFFGPGRIMDDPHIILTSISYRFGALGFLSTGDDASPGNYGLMDQSLALKWLYDNIEAFGGDSNRITIIGESAGGASVELHLLSPMSSGLFQNAISMSGSALAVWAFQEHPLYWAEQLAETLDCPTKTTTGLVKCMKQIPTSDIVRSEKLITNIGLMPSFGFTPTLDGKFLLQAPRDSMISGNITNKVPLITGINKDEALLFYIGMLRDHPGENLLSKEVITGLMNILADNTGRSTDAGELFANKYLSSADFSNVQETRETVIKMITHMMFEMSHYETVMLRATHGLTTYAYRLDYDPSFGYNEMIGSDLKGVVHADDHFLMFDGPVFGLLKPNANDTKIIDVIRKLFTNYANVGEPTPKISTLMPIRWEPATVGNITIYHIDNPISTTVFEARKDELYQFWVKEVLKVIYRKKEEM